MIHVAANFAKRSSSKDNSSSSMSSYKAPTEAEREQDIITIEAEREQDKITMKKREEQDKIDAINLYRSAIVFSHTNVLTCTIHELRLKNQSVTQDVNVAFIDGCIILLFINNDNISEISLHYSGNFADIPQNSNKKYYVTKVDYDNPKYSNIRNKMVVFDSIKLDNTKSNIQSPINKIMYMISSYGMSDMPIKPASMFSMFSETPKYKFNPNTYRQTGIYMKELYGSNLNKKIGNKIIAGIFSSDIERTDEMLNKILWNFASGITETTKAYILPCNYPINTDGTLTSPCNNSKIKSTIIINKKTITNKVDTASPLYRYKLDNIDMWNNIFEQTNCVSRVKNTKPTIDCKTCVNQNIFNMVLAIIKSEAKTGGYKPRHKTAKRRRFLTMRKSRKRKHKQKQKQNSF